MKWIGVTLKWKKSHLKILMGIVWKSVTWGATWLLCSEQLIVQRQMKAYNLYVFSFIEKKKCLLWDHRHYCLVKFLNLLFNIGNSSFWFHQSSPEYSPWHFWLELHFQSWQSHLFHDCSSSVRWWYWSCLAFTSAATSILTLVVLVVQFHIHLLHTLAPHNGSPLTELLQDRFKRFSKFSGWIFNLRRYLIIHLSGHKSTGFKLSKSLNQHFLSYIWDNAL